MFYRWTSIEMLLLNLEWVFPKINVHKYIFFPRTEGNILCPFCCNKTENEIRRLFECPAYTPLRARCMSMPHSVNENDHQKYFVRIMENENILNVAKLFFYALELRL